MASESNFPTAAVKRALRDAWTRSRSFIDFKASKKITREKLKKDGTPSKIGSVFYQCNECKEEFKETEKTDRKTKKGNTRRKFLVRVDHVEPVISPEVGFTSWEAVWKNMYIPPEHWDTDLQILCNDCHKEKTDEEKKERAKYGSLKKGRRKRKTDKTNTGQDPDVAGQDKDTQSDTCDKSSSGDW